MAIGLQEPGVAVCFSKPEHQRLVRVIRTLGWPVFDRDNTFNQNVGGVQALTMMQRSGPTLRKRCGLRLSKI